MHAITYTLVFHKNENRILVQFETNDAWNKRIQKLSGVKWSRTLKGWTIPDTPGNRKKCGLPPVSTINASTTKHIPTQPPAVAASSKTASYNISENNKQELNRFLQQLALKGYSLSTVRTYRNEFTQLLYVLSNHKVQLLQSEHLRRYLVWCIKNGLSEHGVHSRMNALKFYFEQVLNREKFFFEIPRPKKPVQLPKLLNENELARLFNAVENKKHKAMLLTAYSAGLRLSEIVNLKIADIDSKRMQIFVRRAKGKKDRYVNLSPVVLDILRKYITTYKPQPKVYLFESEQTNTCYPVRTVQQIFSNAKQKAGIKKEVGVHSLRHSFATHLLDKGTDIKYIKELLGHFDIKTTERYLHVSKKKLVNIISPFDDLWKNEALEW